MYELVNKQSFLNSGMPSSLAGWTRRSVPAAGGWERGYEAGGVRPVGAAGRGGAGRPRRAGLFAAAAASWRRRCWKPSGRSYENSRLRPGVSGFPQDAGEALAPRRERPGPSWVADTASHPSSCSPGAQNLVHVTDRQAPSAHFRHSPLPPPGAGPTLPPPVFAGPRSSWA